MGSLSQDSTYIKPHSPKTSQLHLWPVADAEMNHLEGRKMEKCFFLLCDDLVTVIKTKSSRYIFTKYDNLMFNFYTSLCLSFPVWHIPQTDIHVSWKDASFF